MSTTHGRTADGTPITDEMVEVIADEAERGYDVEQICVADAAAGSRWARRRHRSNRYALMVLRT